MTRFDRLDAYNAWRIAKDEQKFAQSLRQSILNLKEKMNKDIASGGDGKLEKTKIDILQDMLFTTGSTTSNQYDQFKRLNQIEEQITTQQDELNNLKDNLNDLEQKIEDLEQTINDRMT